MTDVVKVQRPIITNDPHEPALVYAKGNRNMAQQKLDHATLKAMGDDMKAYFEAEWRHELKLWSIGKRVRDRSW